MVSNMSIQPINTKNVVIATNKTKMPAQTPEANMQVANQNFQYSPLLTKMIIAQNGQILPKKVQNVQNVEKTNVVTNYKNDLKTLFVKNQATILAVIPRTMNAQDTDGNELIQGNEISGNFVNIG